MRLSSKTLLWSQFRWLMVLPVVALWSPLSAQEVHLASVHPSAQQELATCDRLVEAGQFEEAVSHFQELLESALGENQLVVNSSASRPGWGAVYAPLTRYLAAFATSRPEKFLEQYRTAYDARAHGLRLRALERKSPDGLLEVCRRYPASTSASRAAIEAGDLLFERGESARALLAWESPPWESVPVPDQKLLARRAVVVAALSGSGRQYYLWGKRWHELPFSKGEASRVLPTFLPAGWATSPPEVNFTGTMVDFAWSTTGVIKSSPLKSLFGDRVRYALSPEVDDESVTLVTPLSLRRFDLFTGKMVAEVSLPHGSQYREHDGDWRLQPALGADQHVATSYVAWASPREGRGWGSGLIKVAMPRRALRVLQVGEERSRTVWDTRMSFSEPWVAELSFNSQPLIQGDTLYALGWKQSGYIDAFLVAFDLRQPRVLWRTLVGSGQIDLTRFGELAAEPILGSIACDEAGVYVSTQLGLCAAIHRHDGSYRWVTRYSPVRPLIPLFERRRMRYPLHRKTWWEPGPVHLTADRLLIAPQDSSYLFSMDPETGRVQGRRRALRDNGHVLGRVDDFLVIAHQREVLRIPLGDLAADPEVYPLRPWTTARPALVSSGIVYTSEDGLYYRAFSASKSQLLTTSLSQGSGKSTRGTSRNRRRQGVVPRDGAVTVFGDHILVTNSFGLRCYRISPRE